MIEFSEKLNDAYDGFSHIRIDLMKPIESKHFWFVNRKKFILHLFEKHFSRTSEILEIGPGTCDIALDLKRTGYKISVGDIHDNALHYAKSVGIDQRFRFNMLNPPFREHFDAIALFDVLEHIENHEKALQCCHAMLKDNGSVIATVPAHQWLWSRDDARAKHFRRYKRSELETLFENCGYTVILAKSIFFSIMPLLYLRTFILRDNKSKVVSSDVEKEIKITPIINGILHFITSIEFFLLRYFSPHIGGSIIIIARKTSQLKSKRI